MSYFDQTEPLVRDRRLSAADSYHGSGCDFAKCAAEGCLCNKNRSFWQANSCQLSLSLMMASTIENAAIILHSPMGCGVNMSTLYSNVTGGRNKRGLGQNNLVWLTTNMQKVDIINGGEKKLRELIRYTDREYRPEVIFVVSACAPSIIGDDVDEVVNSEKDNIAADLAAIHCPGFKSRVVASAYDSFYHALIRHIKFEPEAYVDYNPDNFDNPYNGDQTALYHYNKSKTVNLFNATSMNPDDENEIVRLLQALDLNVRIFTEYSSREKLRLISEASLNISMCNVHDDYILKFLEEKYGIPYLIQGMPLGKKGIREWLLKVAEFFGKEKDAEKICDYEERRLDKALKPFMETIKGKRVIMGGGVVRVAEEARMLSELGMEVIGIRPYHYDDEAKEVYDEIADEFPETPLAVSTQLFELVNQLKEYKPDIVVEHAGKHGWIAKCGIPSVNLFSQARPFFGYAGEYAFVKNLAFHLQNNGYAENLSKNISLPYFRSWYEKDAYSYIK